MKAKMELKWYQTMIPTHNHSEFSAQTWPGTAVLMAARVQSLGMNGAWLTDHGTLEVLHRHSGRSDKTVFVRWYLGIEAYQAPESRFVKRATCQRHSEE